MAFRKLFVTYQLQVDNGLITFRTPSFQKLNLSVFTVVSNLLNLIKL